MKEWMEYLKRNKADRLMLAGIGALVVLLVCLGMSIRWDLSGGAEPKAALQDKGAGREETAARSAGRDAVEAGFFPFGPDRAPEEELILPIQAENGQWGYVDMEGKMVIFPQFDEATAFMDTGMAYVRAGSTAGYINKAGEWVIGPMDMDDYFKFSEIEELAANQEAAEKAGLEDLPPQVFSVCGNVGAVGLDGKVAIPFRYDSLYAMQDVGEARYVGMYETEKKENYDSGYEEEIVGYTYTLLNEEGKELSPSGCDYISYYECCGRIMFGKDGKYGYLGMDGEVVIEPVYDAARDFIENTGLAVVQRTGLDGRAGYGLIDTQGRVVVPLVYEDYFTPGYLYEEDGGNAEAIYIFQNREGRMEIYNATRGKFMDETFDFADNSATESNFIVVGRNGRSGAINNLGEVLIDFRYDSLYPPDEKGAVLAVRSSDGAWGMLDRRGNTIVDFIYDDVWLYDQNGFARIENDGKYGMVNREGELVVPAEYGNVASINLGGMMPGIGADMVVIVCFSNDGEGTAIYGKDGTLLYEFTGGETEAIENFEDDGYGIVTRKLAEVLSDMLAEEGQFKTVDELLALIEESAYCSVYEEEVSGGLRIFYNEDGNYGLKDQEGNILIEPVYYGIYERIEEDGMFYVEKKKSDGTDSLQSGFVAIVDGKAYTYMEGDGSLYVMKGGIIGCDRNGTTTLYNKYGDWLVGVTAEGAKGLPGADGLPFVEE